jgi:hypothetical protein
MILRRSIILNLLLNVLVINTVFDILGLFFESRGIFAIARAIVIVIPFTQLLLNLGSPLSYASWAILFFTAYTCVLIPFSSNVSESVRISMQVCIPLLYFILGEKLGRVLGDQYSLAFNQLMVYAMLLLLNFILSTYFEIGNYTYEDDSANLYLGNFVDNIGNFSFLLISMPLLLDGKSMYKKSIVTFLMLFLFIIILVSTKRIALATVMFGFILWLRIPKRRGLVVVFGVLMLAIPLVVILSDYVIDRWQVRAATGRMDGGWYLTEMRFIESVYVWQEILGFDSVAKSLFGLEAFYSNGLYADGLFGNRQLHVDYNLLLFTTGIVGFILYFTIYYCIYIKYRNTKNMLKREERKVLLGLLLGSLLFSFAGQMYSVTFRTNIFFLCGLILSYGNFKLRNEDFNSNAG